MNKNLELYKVKKFSSIREMLAIAEKEAGDKAAFKYKIPNKSNPEGYEVISKTYKEFRAETICLGNSLTSRGYCNKTHVACIGENSYRWVCVYLSVLAGDNVFVPVDKELPSDEMLNVLQRSESSVVFCNEKFEKFIREHKSELPGITLCVNFDRTTDDGMYIAYDTVYNEGKKLAKTGYDSYTKAHSDENELKMLVYTSGTTGISKGVMLSEHNLVSCVYYGLQVSTVYDTDLSILPYHHTYEAVCGILVGLHYHTTICINESVRAVLQNFKLYQPEYVYLVPALAEMFYKRIWRTVEDQGKAGGLHLLIKLSNALRKVGIDRRRSFFKAIHDTFGGKLHKIVCGGAPIRPEVGLFFDAIGISLVNGYGITECSPLVSANREEFNDFNTAGLKLPCVDIKIDRPDELGNGEICVKGDTVMLGYYKDPEQTAEVLKDGWFYTGDYGNLNKYGQITITGRKKNIIILKNGKNIYPEEIEGYIMSIPYIIEVVVYSIKDTDGNDNALCAEAFLDEAKAKELGTPDIEAKLKTDIHEALKELPVYKQVSKVVIRNEEFVKNSSRKIRRMAIKH